MALDGGRRRHLRGDQVRARAAALATLEVAVRRRGDPLAGGGDVRVHAQAHRTAGVTPVKAGAPEDLIQALALGLELDLLGTGDDHRVDAVGHLATAYDLGGGAQITDP